MNHKKAAAALQTGTNVVFARMNRKKNTEQIDFSSGTGYTKEKVLESERHVKEI